MIPETSVNSDQDGNFKIQNAPVGRLEARKGPTPLLATPTPSDSQYPYSYGLAITNGTSVTTTGNSGLPPNGFLVPAPQLEDGSFAGTLQEGTGGLSNGQITMVGFDSGGNFHWSVVFSPGLRWYR